MKRKDRKIRALAIVTVFMAAGLVLPGMNHSASLTPAPVARTGQTISYRARRRRGSAEGRGLA